MAPQTPDQTTSTNGNPMRILAISSWWPEPADNGIRLRLSRLLGGLGAHHELHLLALTQAEHLAATALPPYCASAAHLPAPTVRLSRGDRLASLVLPSPASVRAAWSPDFAALVRRRAAQVRPDVVVAFELSAAPYALLVPGAPRLLDDLEMATIYDGFAAAAGRGRLRAWLTWAKHKAYVRHILRGFAACTAVSEREAALVRHLAPARMSVAIVPNGADVGPLPQATSPEPDTLIYPGALSYAANLDAMRFFLGEVLPRIRAARPEVRLRITGRITAEQRAALPSLDGVELTGFVPDIKTLIARSWAEVVPLRHGSGTRLKILEALALGTPVVSTAKGAEGLDLEPGRHLLIADSPAELAATTLLLLAQPALRERLAAEGWRAVAATYDWRSIGARLEALTRAVVSEGSAAYVAQLA